MSTEQPEPAAPTSASTPAARTGPSRTTMGLVAAGVAALAVAVGFFAGVWFTGRATPAETSTEAGFARDMQTHHAQAVEMALIVRDRSADPTIRALAYDIATSQQQQIGQMYAWLEDWGLPQTGTQPPMAWMSGAGHADMGAATSTLSGTPPATTAGAMPGMATPEDLQRLATLGGAEAEALFLQLMIAHHQGGVTMAQAALERARDQQVRTLASAIVTGQQSEIDLMRQLLATRAATR